MSTDIKPGDDIVTIQDAPTLLGHTIPQGTCGRVLRSGPPIVGPYSVYAHFEGDRPGHGRQVRPGDVAVVSPTPAPLDPAAVKAGDTVTVSATTTSGAAYEIAGVVWEPSHSPGSLWVGPVALDATALTLTGHQPAPAPEPEWEPGTSGTATVHHLASDSAFDMRVMRVEWDVRPGFATQTGRVIEDGSPEWSVSDFVPDEPRTLPTREEVAEAITRGTRHDGDGYRVVSGPAAADRVLALLRGESR